MNYSLITALPIATSADPHICFLSVASSLTLELINCWYVPNDWCIDAVSAIRYVIFWKKINTICIWIILWIHFKTQLLKHYTNATECDIIQ